MELFLSEFIPHWVKKRYSPKSNWKDRPFEVKDVHFFSRGLKELSQLFTEDRAIRFKQSPEPYFRHPRFRSAYLLYFLPLQATKFFHILDTEGESTDKIPYRILDIGSGPATASIATLFWIKKKFGKALNRTIEITLVDTEKSILEDGRLLLEAVSEQLDIPLKITIIATSWHFAIPKLRSQFDMILLGHVLNETPQNEKNNAASTRALESAWSLLDPKTGSMLFIEPALRQTAQRLAEIRDTWIEKQSASIIAPCLHAGACPLSRGRDWCHFSTPLKIKSRWFQAFGKSLGSEREWMKYTTLWLSLPKKLPRYGTEVRRVVSDPMGKPPVVLLCEPEKVRRLGLNATQKTSRGELLRINTAPKRR